MSNFLHSFSHLVVSTNGRSVRPSVAGFFFCKFLTSKLEKSASKLSNSRELVQKSKKSVKNHRNVQIITQPPEKGEESCNGSGRVVASKELLCSGNAPFGLLGQLGDEKKLFTWHGHGVWMFGFGLASEWLGELNWKECSKRQFFFVQLQHRRGEHLTKRKVCVWNNVSMLVTSPKEHYLHLRLRNHYWV